MKKLYTLILAAAAALSASASSSQLYIMGNPAGGWNYNQGIEMTQVSSGVFTYELHATSSQWFAFTDLLGSSWNETNAHRYAPQGANNTVPSGETNAMAYGKDASWQLPAGDYTLTVNTNTMNLSVGGIVDVKLTNLYLRGDISNWEALPAYAFTTTDNNVWTLKVDAIEAGSAFKLGSDDWGFSYTANNLELALDQVYDLEEGGEDNNMAFAQNITDATFTFNFDAKTLTVSGNGGGVIVRPIEIPENLYICGNINGTEWSTANAPALTKDGNIFKAEAVEVNDAGEGYGYFSFISVLGADWDAVNGSNRFGAPAADTPIDEMLPGTLTLYAANVNASACNSWKCPAGKYNITVDFDKNSVSLAINSGINDIETEINTEARYFNMQGVQVSKPENGLYIKVCGNKAAKVFIR